MVQSLERPSRSLYHESVRTVVSYIRVSTQRQGASGLGLEGQRAAVAAFCRENRCALLDEYQEIESGRKSERPVLRKALARAKAAKAVLLIAKLDRLARNVAFIANLMEAGVEFRACDMPHANRLTVHIMAAVAEDEARRISERTKTALAAYKARGGLLGAANPACRRLTTEHRARGSVASGRRAALVARESNAEVTTIARDLKGDGLSLRAIATALDARGFYTRTGKKWNHVQVLRLLRSAA
ncbi:MAG: recombinase family protein [Candidatus Tumulicola sp.]